MGVRIEAPTKEVQKAAHTLQVTAVQDPIKTHTLVTLPLTGKPINTKALKVPMSIVKELTANIKIQFLHNSMVKNIQ